MKTLLYSLALAIMVFSCQEEPKIEYAIVKGTIANKKSDKLQLSSLVSSFRKEIPLNEDGSFLDTLKIDGEYIMIYDGSNVNYAFLEGGDDLTIKYDLKDYNNTINFSGKGSKVNDYLVSKKKKEREIIGKGVNVFTLDEEQFVDMQKNIESSLLEHLTNTPDLKDAYIDKEKRNIRYTYLDNLSKYESAHSYYAKDPEFKVSNAFLSDLDNMDYNNLEDFNFSYAYTNLVSNYCRKEAQKLTDTESIDQDVAFLKAINKLENQTIINYLLYKNAKSGITFTSDLETYYSEFIKGSTNEDNNQDITSSYNILKSVATGKPSPKFIDYKNYAGGTTSLDDLKGKYVYIDVWATWCGPCKGEIPHLKRVEKQYHDKNIEFVSISVDKERDYEKWKQMIVDENLGGIQLFADNDFKSKFIEDYFIKGIPKFILLDPEGKIITPNAPRPSNDKLISLFNTLNI